MAYLPNPHFDTHYGKVGLEERVESKSSPQISYDFNYAPLPSSKPTYEAPPVISYSVQGWKAAEGKRVKFTRHYDRNNPDFTRGDIYFGSEDGVNTVTVDSDQIKDETAETVLHETGPEGHGNAGGHDEARVTNYNYTITHRI